MEAVSIPDKLPGSAVAGPWATPWGPWWELGGRREWQCMRSRGSSHHSPVGVAQSPSRGVSATGEKSPHLGFTSQVFLH